MLYAHSAAYAARPAACPVSPIAILLVLQYTYARPAAYMLVLQPIQLVLLPILLVLCVYTILYVLYYVPCKRQGDVYL